MRGSAGSGAALPRSRPAPRTPAPSDGGATAPGQTQAGGEVKWRIFYLILLWGCSEVAKTWGQAAPLTWNLSGMTKDSFSRMLATFQGLPRWF